MATEEQELTSSKLTDEIWGGSQKLCEAFIVLAIGELLTYSRIADIIGRDPQQGGRSVVLRAAEMALRKHGIKILCEVNHGYKRVGFDGRREWIISRGEQVQRVNVRRFLTASHVEQGEFEAFTVDEKQKLAAEATRVGIQLSVNERLNKIKKLPPVERVKLVDLSDLGRVFKKQS